MDDNVMAQRRVWRNPTCDLNVALDRLDEQSIDALIIRSLPADDARLTVIAQRAARRAG